MFEFLKNISRKRVSDKPSAVAFVDFEHWYISLDRLFHTRPDIKGWRDELAQKFDLKEIVFFADFSNQSIRQEIPRIREISNYIIETQNTSSSFKKDFTDFIMLDHIYQKALTAEDIDVFVIFTGDGHFNSVTNYLTTRMHKQVGIYGIRDATSNQLRNTCSWFELLPREEKAAPPTVESVILNHIKQLQDDNTKKQKGRITFWPTVEAISRLNDFGKTEIAASMRTMIEKGYLFQTQEKVGMNKSIKVLNVDWEKCISDKLIPAPVPEKPEKSQKPRQKK